MVVDFCNDEYILHSSREILTFELTGPGASNFDLKRLTKSKQANYKVGLENDISMIITY